MRGPVEGSSKSTGLNIKYLDIAQTKTDFLSAKRVETESEELILSFLSPHRRKLIEDTVEGVKLSVVKSQQK